MSPESNRSAGSDTGEPRAPLDDLRPEGPDAGVDSEAQPRWRQVAWKTVLHGLGSRLALRMIVVFGIGGLVPLILFGSLAWVQVIDELEDQVEMRLRQETKGVGMGVVERLLQIDASLSMLATHGRSSDIPPGVWDLLPDRFENLAMGRVDDPVTILLGEPQPLRPVSDEWQHLRSGKALIRIGRATELGASVTFARLVSEDGLLVWGEVDPTYLWDLGPQGSLPAQVDLAVVGGGGVFLVRSESIPSPLAARLQELSEDDSTLPIRWESAGETHLGSFWKIPMSNNYLAEKWVVALGLERSLARESLGRWRATFPLALLLTLWVVLLLVLVQVRRSLDPLSRLSEAAARMAAGDLRARAVVQTDDEFEDLAEGFNLMAAEISQQFETLSMVTLLGREAIAGADDRALLGTFLESLHIGLGFRTAAIMLEDGDGFYLGQLGLRLQGRSRAGSVRREERVDAVQIERRQGSFRDLMAPEVGGAAWLLTDRPWRPDMEFPVSIDGRVLGVLAVANGPAKALRALPELAEHLALVWRHRRLAKDLEQERAMLGELVEQLPHGLVLLDGERRILIANRLARDYLRDLSDATPGERLVRLGQMTLEDPESADSVRWQELEMPEPFRRIFIVAQANMGPSRSVLMMRDVTQEREMQAQLHQQDRLAAVGQLAAGMAHDLNNTLQVILSTSELILRRPDGEQVKEYAERVLEQSRRGSHLIRQVLDFSRRSTPSPRPLSLNRLLRESLVLLRRLLSESVELRARPCGQELVVHADPTQVQQVVTNLVLNARDAVGDRGWIEIGLDTATELPAGILPRESSEDPPGGWAEISVSDSGPGVPESLRSQIFEPFFTTKDLGYGTGLGLAQVYGIIDSHGGAVCMESGFGQSTRFRIFLPRDPSSVEEPEPTSEEPTRGGEQHVLVVEDHEIVRVVITANLESLGYRVETAINGVRALELLRARQAREGGGEPFDLMVSDVNMPEMDGTMLARIVSEEFPDLPILLLSGYVAEDAAILSDLPGVVGLLQKPVSLEELSTAVLEALPQTALR